MLTQAANRISVTCYTDPLCCWSWAMEPQIRKFRFHFRNYIDWQYVLGGLIPSWGNFIDGINSVSRPAQMGPVWLHAAEVSGMPMATRLWAEDPPASSFPACVAIKCVMMQSQTAGDRYLRLLREVCMIQGQNIAKPEVITAVAQQLSAIEPAFDYELFCRDYNGTAAQQLFRQDWQGTKSLDIGRFPTLVIRCNAETVRISGYKSFGSLCASLYFLRPELKKIAITETLDDYRQYWNKLTIREEDEFLGTLDRHSAAYQGVEQGASE